MNKLPRYAFLIVCILGLLTACGSPDAEPAARTSPTQVATDTPAAPTETQPPAATATAALKDLEILGSIDAIAGFKYEEDFYMELLVRNSNDFPVLAIVKARILDSTGQLVEEADPTYAEVVQGQHTGGVGMILPGHVATVHACFSCKLPGGQSTPSEARERLHALGENWADHAEFEFVLFIVLEPVAYSTDFDLLEVNFSKGFFDSYSYRMQGRIQNTSEHTFSADGAGFPLVSIRAICFDQDGNFAGAGEAAAMGELNTETYLFADIEPGDQAAFDGSFSSNFQPESLNCEYTVIAKITQP